MVTEDVRVVDGGGDGVAEKVRRRAEGRTAADEGEGESGYDEGGGAKRCTSLSVISKSSNVDGGGGD